MRVTRGQLAVSRLQYGFSEGGWLEICKGVAEIWVWRAITVTYTTEDSTAAEEWLKN